VTNTLTRDFFCSDPPEPFATLSLAGLEERDAAARHVGMNIDKHSIRLALLIAFAVALAVCAAFSIVIDGYQIAS
jgi:hypothetical protein